MSEKVRAILGFVGFIAVAAFVMSDRYEDFRSSIPESAYFYVYGLILLGITALGLYAWWQHYNRRQLHPTVDRVKKWFESPAWWNWPF
jgi:H+/Cl- antiporter ClcA